MQAAPGDWDSIGVHGPHLMFVFRIESSLTMGIVAQMKCLRSLVAMVMLLVWLPAQGHCLLERTGWIWGDDCCSETESNAPCSAKPCCNLDSPTYKLSNHRATFVVPDPIEVFLPPVVDQTAVLLAHTRFPTVGPPELPVRWQFVYRAALPVRAPSLAS